MSTSASTLPTGPSVPDDIRLKCSYYASEIKNQVNSLYEEQHKWLEDHLSEIKETLVKVTEKKAGTRYVHVPWQILCNDMVILFNSLLFLSQGRHGRYYQNSIS